MRNEEWIEARLSGKEKFVVEQWTCGIWWSGMNGMSECELAASVNNWLIKTNWNGMKPNEAKKLINSQFQK